MAFVARCRLHVRFYDSHLLGDARGAALSETKERISAKRRQCWRIPTAEMFCLSRKGAASLAERRALHQYFAAVVWAIGMCDSAVSSVDCAHLEKLLDARDAAATYAWRSEEGGYGYATITPDEGLSDLAAILSEKEQAVQSAKKVFEKRRKRARLRYWKPTLYYQQHQQTQN